jgi:basic amino acid/polyamine antiporter, APA family
MARDPRTHGAGGTEGPARTNEPGRAHEPGRTLGLLAAVSMVIGTVIGSGIFLVTSQMMLSVGSTHKVLAVWVFGGILTMFGALSYAELSGAMPHSGAEYVYLKAAYGPVWGFIYGWTITWVAKPGSAAALASGGYRYLAEFFPGLNDVVFSVALPIGPGGGPLDIHKGQFLGAGLILLFSGVNMLGTRLGGGMQVAGTGLKVALIAGIILGGLATGHGSMANFHSSLPVASDVHAIGPVPSGTAPSVPIPGSAGATGGVAGFFVALVAALWAYDGWNTASMIGSDIQNPQKNLPRALIWGTAAVIAIYVTANLAYLYVLRAPEVAASQRVAADMMRRVAGSSGAAMVSVAAIVSILAALNGVLISGSRVPFAMARDGYFFAWVGKISRFQTPAASLALQGVWSVLLLASGRFEDIIKMVIFTEWILYGMATAAVLVLRKTRPEMPRPYRVWGYPLVPIVFVLVAAALLYATLRESPRESGMGLGLIGIGLPFYYYWKRRESGSGAIPGRRKNGLNE